MILECSNRERQGEGHGSLGSFGNVKNENGNGMLEFCMDNSLMFGDYL